MEVRSTYLVADLKNTFIMITVLCAHFIRDRIVFSRLVHNAGDHGRPVGQTTGLLVGLSMIMGQISPHPFAGNARESLI